jgi:dihydroorotate dehydrogenase
MYKAIVRPILFLFDPEKVHYFTFSLIRFLSKVPFVSSLFRGMYQVNDPKLERKLFGLTFKNPVGLAAGFDKNAVNI